MPAAQVVEIANTATRALTTTPSMITVPPVKATINPKIKTADQTRYQGRFLVKQFKRHAVFMVFRFKIGLFPVKG